MAEGHAAKPKPARVALAAPKGHKWPAKGYGGPVPPWGLLLEVGLCKGEGSACGATCAAGRFDPLGSVVMPRPRGCVRLSYPQGASRARARDYR